LSRDFFARETRLVARELLGQALVHVGDDGLRRSGAIVETEAYVGPDDAASHARSGPNGRARLMWGPAGVAYVYLIYGLHHCFNVVTEKDGYPGAVLVRALEPLENVDRASGPALVCKALQIDRGCNGEDLTRSVSLFIEPGTAIADTQVRMGPRIGVDYAGDWAAHPLRFWVAASKYVSRRSQTGTAYDAAMLR
jgi:DNA-3-methyladenine glycosylase